MKRKKQRFEVVSLTCTRVPALGSKVQGKVIHSVQLNLFNGSVYQVEVK